MKRDWMAYISEVIHKARTLRTDARVLGRMTLEQTEHLRIELAMLQTFGHREDAARMLGIPQRTLYRKLKRYGLLETGLLSMATIKLATERRSE